MRLADRAKLFVLMLLGRLPHPARALAALGITAIAAACGGGSPGPGPQPTDVRVTAVSPNSGTTFGGTTLTITGSGFQTGAAVQIGGTPATDVTVTTPTTLTAKTPAHVAGAADVRVTVATKTGTLANAFTFVKPVTGANTAPVVSTISVQPPRPDQPLTLASTGDRISLTAAVNDAETPAGQLTYEWTSTPTAGTFSGTGAAVQWTAPSTVTVPQSVALTLTVIERYQEPDAQGLPVNREHRVQRAVLIKVHNSQKEVTDMAVDFWKLFLTSSITSPPAVLHNFSRTCDDGFGYLLEQGDIEEHRKNIEVISYTITPPSVFEYAFGSRQACTRKAGSVGDACVEVPVQVRERVKASNVVRDVRGTGYLTGVYESAQWRLCYSLWTGVDTLTSRPVVLDVTTRRDIIKSPRDK